MQIRGGEEKGEVDPAMQQSIQEPTKKGEEEEEEGAPSYELLIQGHTWGKKKRERREKEKKGEEEEKTRREMTLPAMHLASRDTPRRGRRGCSRGA